jgi:HAD superfamily hydrolase (TIGR01509 family)
LPPGTQDFLKIAGALAQPGVLTTAPRTYAERLLKHHGLILPVLVAYHDVSRRKPDPEPILTAAERLGISQGRCICVGDSAEDGLAATAAGAFAIKISWSPTVPDERQRAEVAVCDDWDHVLQVVRDIIKAHPG